MDARGIFRDERRDRLRKKTKVGFFEDYFFRSEVTDYKKLRYIVNGFIGVIVCTCIYYMGWKRLNFADFHPIYSILFQWVMILMIVFAFSASAMFRCALFCVLLGSLGKNGQAPLTMMLFDNLREGPMENIITNYRLTAEIIVCHLELQAKIISNRVSLFTGPLEAVLETQLNRGLKVLKKATSFVRRLIAPFMNEISPKYTKEDEILDKTDKQLQILVRRRALGVATDDELHSLTELEMRNITNSQPFWSRFKTDIGRRIAHRMSKKCNDIFSKGVETCREVFLGVENKCYDTLPFIINFLVCKRLNMESACQDIDRRRKSFKLCQSHLESSNIGSAMEADILEVANLTTELDREAAVNIHMVGIENPRVEFIYSISEISLMVRHTAAHAKALMLTLKQFVQGLLIFFVYRIFRDSVSIIHSYNNNIDFQNNYLTRSFWEIDRNRQKNGQVALIHINHMEMQKWKLLHVVGWPTDDEIEKAKHPFYRWIILTLIILFVIAIDHYLYSFLYKVVTSSKTIKETEETAQLQVLGEGVVAEFLHRMLNINRTIEVDHVNNEHCLSLPTRPDFSERVKWLLIPLTISLIMQVLFSFVIKRIIINYFLPFMYPLRDRVRLIYFYNKILFLRTTSRTEARSKIRFSATRWKINANKTDRSWLSPRSWFKLKVLDRIFRTGQCIMCETYMKPVKLKYCLDCPATFCKFCVEETGGDCYACMAEDGIVNTEYTMPTIVESLSAIRRNCEENFQDHVQKAYQVI